MIEGGWTPDGKEVSGLEAHLGEITQLRSHHGSVSHPEQSFREYVGIVVSGKHLIYVNAMPKNLATASRKEFRSGRPTIICDGGPTLWGVIYDPATKQFVDLQTNGGFGGAR